MAERCLEQAAEDARGGLDKPAIPLAVIYGQEVLYAARGQEARSRDGQEVLYAARGQEARSRDG